MPLWSSVIPERPADASPRWKLLGQSTMLRTSACSNGGVAVTCHGHSTRNPPSGSRATVPTTVGRPCGAEEDCDEGDGGDQTMTCTASCRRWMRLRLRSSSVLTIIAAEKAEVDACCRTAATGTISRPASAEGAMARWP